MNELTNRVNYAVGVDLGATFAKFTLVSEIDDILYTDELPLGKNATREVIFSILHTAIHSTLRQPEKLKK